MSQYRRLYALDFSIHHPDNAERFRANEASRRRLVTIWSPADKSFRSFPAAHVRPISLPEIWWNVVETDRFAPEPELVGWPETRHSAELACGSKVPLPGRVPKTIGDPQKISQETASGRIGNGSSIRRKAFIGSVSRPSSRPGA